MGRVRQVAKIYKKDLRIKATPAEIRFKAFLDHYHFNYAFQQIIMKKQRKGFYIVDFAIKMNPKIFIELDGSHHAIQEQLDTERTENILNIKKYSDYKFMRFTNKEVYNGEAQNIIASIYPKQISKYS